MLIKSTLFVAPLFGAAVHTVNTPFITNWLPFIGTVIAAILTSSVAYIAYRRSRRSEDKQERLQGEMALLTGFNDFTERLQAQVELQETHIGLLKREVDECNRDRVQLRKLIESQRTEVDMLKHLVLSDGSKGKR